MTHIGNFMINDQFSELLRKWIKDNYHSTKDFSRISGINYSNLNNYLRGVRNPSVQMIAKLQSLGFSAVEATGMDDLFSTIKSQVSTGIAPGVVKPNATSSFVKLLDIEATASRGINVYSDEGFVFDNKYLRMKGLLNSELSVIYVNDNSMAPALGDTDLILVQHNCELIQGKIFVINYEDKIVVRRMRLIKEKWTMYFDSNQSQPVLMPEDSRVIGRVVSVMHDL